MFCLSVMHSMISRDTYFDFLKRVLLPDALKASVRCCIFDKAVFCLGEEQGIYVNQRKGRCWLMTSLKPVGSHFKEYGELCKGNSRGMYTEPVVVVESA